MKTLFLLILCMSLYALPQEIALTFDDIPRSSGPFFSAEERTNQLIKILKEAGVEDVMLFVNTSRINSKTQSRMDAYREAGFHVANHSHSHFSPNRVELDVYLQDITEAHEQLKDDPQFLPFYRYPYLHHGKDRHTRDAIHVHLKKLNYQIGYVTVDNYDWYMAALLRKAVRDSMSIDMDKLRETYVEVMWSGIQFYDNIAKETLGRSPKHVLLLHENDISTLFIGDLIAHLRKKGWKIISPQEAYQDPIAQNIPDVLFNNQGRVAAIAHAMGKKKRGLVYKAEDEAYLEKLFTEKNIFNSQNP